MLDYYRILQVHPLAEPEVIESAYRRLAKKYHPDVNRAKDAGIRMEQINEAYEVLKNPGKRRAYDAGLVRQQRAPAEKEDVREDIWTGKNRENIHPAQPVLSKYFLSIKDRNYEDAYALISSADKNRISPADFASWQSAVSKVYRLEEFECSVNKTEYDRKLCGVPYSRVTEFSVVTVEHNTVMNRLEKDIINKNVVLERDGWHIFLGYQDIKPYIAKFEELSELLTAKEVVHEMVELYSNKDLLSGTLNKKGFIQEAEKELWRCARYGNPFTLMLLELHYRKRKDQQFADCATAWAGKTLKSSFRKLDVIGRWEESSFMILMPETGLSGGLRAALKIRDIFASEKLMYNRKAQRVTASIGVEEFCASLEDTIGRLNQYLSAARRRRGGAVVYSGGVYMNEEKTCADG